MTEKLIPLHAFSISAPAQTGWRSKGGVQTRPYIQSTKEQRGSKRNNLFAFSTL